MICGHGFDVFLVIEMFETSLMWLETYNQVVWVDLVWYDVVF